MKVLTNVQKKSNGNPTPTSRADHVYYFGPFCLKQGEQQLLRNGESIRLAPKAFDVLLVLLRNQGRLVTKDKLLAEVWPDAFVEEANLSVNIARLRKALDEDNAKRRYIETVPKRGYRFVAGLSEFNCDSSQTLKENKGKRHQIPDSVAVLDLENASRGPVSEHPSAELTKSIICGLSQLQDLLVVQEEIATEISERLRTGLTVDKKRPIVKCHTDNSEACNSYLKGRYHWNKFAQKSLGQAIAYFRQAIEVDPTYALAYAGLADSYHRLSDNYLPTAETMPLARLAATKALEIDETLAEAHTALGMVWMFYSRDWSAAEQEFSRAIELSPRCSMAHQRLALYFSLLGRFDEAKSEIHMAIELDPLSLHTSQVVALQFFLKGDFEQAIEQQQKTLETDPNYHPAYYLLGWVYKRKGDLAKAVDSFVKAAVLDDCPLLLGALAHAYGLTGNRIKALSILDGLEEQSKRRYVSSYSRAVAYIGLDEKDQAFYWLEKALQERSVMLTWLKVGSEFDDLRDDPRFRDLLRRVNFPA